MVRLSLGFVLAALFCMAAADLSVTVHDPWAELGRMAAGFVRPDFFSLPGLARALGNTVSFALIGIVLAVAGGFCLSLVFHLAWVRMFCAFIRSVHELFWAFIFMPVAGLSSLCGILAIAVPYAGVFAKVYDEIRQESDTRPDQALPEATHVVSRFVYARLPLIYQDMKAYTAYRFECALRSSAILGFIGLPTIGYHLETAFSEGLYQEAAALLYLLYLLILSVRLWARPRIIIFPVLAALALTSWDTAFSLQSLSRFLFYDILPWPMRAQGFYDGTQTLAFDFGAILPWFWDIVTAQVLPGLLHTLVLTQMALVLTALLTLGALVPASRFFFSGWVTLPVHGLLVALRTTPEYILAYMGLLIAGPSMLPALFALSLHNSGILAGILSGQVSRMTLGLDTAASRLSRYGYEVLPRIYSRFLAFLFYRWEVILRESAILGVLGITTLGHYIDSAIAKDHLDTALILILVTALLNMGVDLFSRTIRRRYKISAHVNPS